MNNIVSEEDIQRHTTTVKRIKERGHNYVPDGTIFPKTTDLRLDRALDVIGKDIEMPLFASKTLRL